MKDNISSFQWVAMLSSPISAVLMVNYIKLFVTTTGRGSYVAAAIVAALTFLLLAAVIFLMQKNAYATPLQTVTFLLGRKAGLFFTAIFALGFLFFTVEALNIFLYIVKFYFLPNTPKVVLTIVLFLPTMYMAYCGFRSFTYMSTASLLALFLFLFMFLFTKNNYLTANILPLNDFQWQKIAVSLPFLIISAPAVAASFFALPLCGDHRHLYRKAAVFTAIFCFLMVFLYVAGMMYFGETILKKLVLPFYNLSPFFKGNLLERFDILFMLALLPVVSIYTAFGFSVFTLIQQDIFPGLNARRRKRMILIYSLAVVILSAFTVNRFPLWNVYRYCNVGALAVTAALGLFYLAAAIKRRRRASC